MKPIFSYRILFLFAIACSVHPVCTQTITSQEKKDSLAVVPDSSVRTNPSSVSVTFRSPVISMDVLLDLYDRNIDFELSYSGSHSSMSRRNAQDIPLTAVEVTGIAARQFREKSIEHRDTTFLERRGTMDVYTKDDLKYNKALIHMNAAQKFFSVKRYPSALEEIEMSIEIAPNISLFHSVKGSILYLLGRTEEAKLSWEKALELDPSLDNVRALLLRMY